MSEGPAVQEPGSQLEQVPERESGMGTSIPKPLSIGSRPDSDCCWIESGSSRTSCGVISGDLVMAACGSA